MRSRRSLREATRARLVTEPLLAEMARLQREQAETRALLVQVLQVLREPLPLRLEGPLPTPPETRELLLEVLQAMQPSAEEEISLLAGTLTRSASSPSSAS